MASREFKGKALSMDQAAIDEVAKFCAYFFLAGFAVGTIVKLLIPKTD